MPDKIQLHDVVALMEDVAATHFLTHSLCSYGAAKSVRW